MDTLRRIINDVKQWFHPKFIVRKTSRLIRIIAVLAVVCASFIIIRDEISWQLESEVLVDDQSTYSADSDEYGCNVLGIALRGDVTTYILPEDEGLVDQTSSYQIVNLLNSIENDDEIKAVMLEVDSYGGVPIAGEEIATALKNLNKPVVAWVRGASASSAYLATSGADTIIASKNSEIGGMAIIMSYLDNVEQNRKDGLTYVQLMTGKFKDIASPHKTLTNEDRNLLIRDLEIMHNNMVETIAENRNIEVYKLKNLADGSTMLGEMALENNLIDKIGGIKEVETELAEIIGEEVQICW